MSLRFISIVLLWLGSYINSNIFQIPKLLNFEDLIQKVNETIYLLHFYISEHLTQIHKALLIYHMAYAVLPGGSGEYNVLM